MHNLMTASEENHNWCQELQRIFINHQATPHSLTGQSPADVVFSGLQYSTRLSVTCSKFQPYSKTGAKTDPERNQSIKQYAGRKYYDASSKVKESD